MKKRLIEYFGEDLVKLSDGRLKILFLSLPTVVPLVLLTSCAIIFVTVNTTTFLKTQFVNLPKQAISQSDSEVATIFCYNPNTGDAGLLPCDEPDQITHGKFRYPTGGRNLEGGAQSKRVMVEHSLEVNLNATQSYISDLPVCRGSAWDNCFGAVRWSNGNKYVGEFKNDKSHGHGIMTWVYGEKLVVPKELRTRGKSKIYYPPYFLNLDVYVGEFNDGAPNGKGTCTYSDRAVEECIFNNGEFAYVQKATPTATSEKSNGWTKVSENPAGVFYMNIENVRKVDGFVHWSVLFDMFEKTKDASLSSEMYQQGDCRLLRFRALRLVGYPEQMGLGEGWEVPLAEELRGWQNPVLGAPADIVLKNVCNQ